jgi:aminomethyltransferase
MLPLSHQDIGGWPFLNNPWTFALPYAPDGCGFTKDFVGRDALEHTDYADRTYAFAGFDVRKVATDAPAPAVVDSGGRDIGVVLTCATDMGIGRIDGRIVSVATPDRPDGFSPPGLSCGFVKVSSVLAPGERVTLVKGGRSITVEIVGDIRPDRTARLPLRRMLK